MSKAAALKAYRDSIYDAAKLHANMRVDSRSLPIVGGFMSGLGLIGNAIWRPFKVGGALIFGYGGKDEREFPKMPPLPEEFKNTELEKSFINSWKLKEEATKSSIKGFGKLLDGSITGWWKEASVAEHAAAKDQSVMFPEEMPSRDAGSAGVIGGFVGALLSGRGDSGRNR